MMKLRNQASSKEESILMKFKQQALVISFAVATLIAFAALIHA